MQTSTRHLAQITSIDQVETAGTLTLGAKLWFNALNVVVLTCYVWPLVLWCLVTFSFGFSIAATLLALLFCMGLAGGVVGLSVTYPEWPTNQTLVSRLRNAVGRRKSPLFNVNTSETRLCEIVPRERWKKLCLDTATDLALVKLDRDQLMLEGDRFRYLFPGESILDVQLEQFRPPGNFHTVYMVVLFARTETGVIELPISFRDYGFGSLRGSKRRDDAIKWTERISRIAKGATYEPIISSEYGAEVGRLPPTANPYAAPGPL